MVLMGHSEVRADKYAGAPFYLGVDARALGRGGAFVSEPGTAASVFWNPAALVGLLSPEVMVQHTESFGSLLNQDYIAVAFPSPQNKRGWAWGGSFYSLSGDGIALTELDQSTGRPFVQSFDGHGNYVLTAVLARSLHPKTSESNWQLGIAGSAKALYVDNPAADAWGLGLDLSGWATWDYLSAGINLSDVTSSFLKYNAHRTEIINPHIAAGVQATPPFSIEYIDVTFAASTEIYFEDRREGSQFWSGSLSADSHVGVEIAYKDALSLRGGSNAGSLSLGAGFRAHKLSVDVALTDHDYLDTSYRVSAGYSWR